MSAATAHRLAAYYFDLSKRFWADCDDDSARLYRAIARSYEAIARGAA